MAHKTHHPLARTDNKYTINREDHTLKIRFYPQLPQLKYLNLMTYRNTISKDTSPQYLRSPVGTPGSLTPDRR